MKYGIYYAYWEKEWNGDYKYYIDKISKLCERKRRNIDSRVWTSF